VQGGAALARVGNRSRQGRRAGGARTCEDLAQRVPDRVVERRVGDEATAAERLAVGARCVDRDREGESGALVEGEVRMDRSYALEEAELDAGFVLACQARPLTERVMLDFDQ
jgi:ring-1,2-phenylacetyl-CoA epoxidase subunit PaaE